MSARTTDDNAMRAVPALPAIQWRGTAVNAVTYYKGGLIADVGGVATKVTAAAGLKIRGWCDNTKFTADTSEESLSKVDVLAGQIALDVSGSAPPTAADHLEIVYAEDDHTVNRTSVGGTLSPVGRLVALTTVGGITKAICEVGMLKTDVVDLVATYASLATLASTANGEGASLIGLEDAGTFTAATDVEAALAEIYQHLKSVQGHIDLDPSDFYLLTGAPLAIFANGASAVPGSALVNSEAFGIRWNNNATTDGIVTSFRIPPDADILANATLTIYCSKIGATLADEVTFDVAAFNQVVGALHDADADFGGTTTAIDPIAASKTIQAVTLTLALANLAASPASVTMSIKPTDSLLATDDLVFHGARITYKRKLLTS